MWYNRENTRRKNNDPPTSQNLFASAVRRLRRSADYVHFSVPVSVGRKHQFFSESEGFFILCGLFGWIPSLISSALGIVFSALSLKDGGAKIFLILSSVNAVIGILWGLVALEFVLGYDNVYMY